jgi:hypothetical protein
MKYLTFIRHAESFRDAGPPQALREAMGEFVQRSQRSGILVDTGGLLPSREGVRIRLENGLIRVLEGPFAPSQEVVGGWAILSAESRAEAIGIAREFMELHQRHWPEFEGESELRPMYEAGCTPQRHI